MALTKNQRKALGFLNAVENVNLSFAEGEGQIRSQLSKIFGLTVLENLTAEDRQTFYRLMEKNKYSAAISLVKEGVPNLGEKVRSRISKLLVGVYNDG